MIILTLKHGKHSYSELRFETGLSDRWLTVKLKELEDRGVLEKDGKWYGLVAHFEVSACELSLYMISQSRRVAGELSQLHSVQAIILFGSVPRKEAHEYSDLDMIIVVNEKVGKVRERVVSKISELERRYHLTIEPIILVTEDFLTNIRSDEAGIVYGVAEGFEVLVAKRGKLTRILRERVEEIRKTREYLEEGRIWLKAE
jgi:predicted nucleotidyltransferase